MISYYIIYAPLSLSLSIYIYIYVYVYTCLHIVYCILYMALLALRRWTNSSRARMPISPGRARLVIIITISTYNIKLLITIMFIISSITSTIIIPASSGTSSFWNGALFGKGQMGSALMGSLQSSCLFYSGTFGVLQLAYVYLPKSARAYLFHQSVKMYYFCSDPISVDYISVDPICHKSVYGLVHPNCGCRRSGDSVYFSNILSLVKRILIGQRAARRTPACRFPPPNKKIMTHCRSAWPRLSEYSWLYKMHTLRTHVGILRAKWFETIKELHARMHACMHCLTWRDVRWRDVTFRDSASWYGIV